jgi:hypothetical protein
MHPQEVKGDPEEWIAVFRSVQYPADTCQRIECTLCQKKGEYPFRFQFHVKKKTAEKENGKGRGAGSPA